MQQYSILRRCSPFCWLSLDNLKWHRLGLQTNCSLAYAYGIFSFNCSQMRRNYCNRVSFCRFFASMFTLLFCIIFEFSMEFFTQFFLTKDWFPLLPLRNKVFGLLDDDKALIAEWLMHQSSLGNRPHEVGIRTLPLDDVFAPMKSFSRLQPGIKLHRLSLESNFSDVSRFVFW